MAGFVDIKLTDNTSNVLSEFERACKQALEACGMAAEGYAKAECPVDTGALRNSITHQVSEADKTVQIGTDCEYAPYVELGTGIYATMGGGRSTPWVYCDGRGEWHMTDGNRAQPYLKPAVADHGGDFEKLIEAALK